MSSVIDNLVNNSKSALISAVEIHNKPIFPYRYEVVSILLVNAWELAAKAFLMKNRPEIKVVKDDGTTKTFEECIENVKSTIGKPFFATAENALRIYEYRCNCIHYYQENIDILLYSLASKSVEFYADFLLTNFGIDLADETNLVLIPIGFKRPISPLVFLSNRASTDTTTESVKQFISSILKSTDSLIKEEVDESILVEYRLSLVNENRIKNADIIAAITQDPAKVEGVLRVESTLPDAIFITDEETAKKIRLEEETLFGRIYTETYDDVTRTCKEMFSDFLITKKFWEILRLLKNNPQFHRKRFLDVTKQNGSSKDYYTKAIYAELAKHYTKKEEDSIYPDSPINAATTPVQPV